MSKPADPIMIADKQGKPICIDDCPGGWKITPRERDMIYQAFLITFPDKDWQSSESWDWMQRVSEPRPISTDRIRDFISQGVRTVSGELDSSWGWWVGCSLA